jgi:hypothetical protein
MTIRIPILESQSAPAATAFNSPPPADPAAGNGPDLAATSLAPDPAPAYDPLAWRDEQQRRTAAVDALAQHQRIMSDTLDQLRADPSVDNGANAPGLTGAYLQQYDQTSRQLIAGLPPGAARHSLAALLERNRVTDARAVLADEAQRNLQARQSAFTDGVQTLARDLARQPELLPRRLAFVDQHMIAVDGEEGGPAGFRESMRAHLVDAAVKAQIARDPHGMLAALQARAAGQTPTAATQDAASAQDQADAQEQATSPAGTATQSPGAASSFAANAPASPQPLPNPPADPAADHLVIRALRPQEIAAYLPQARSAASAADTNYRAAVLQRAAAASRQYMASGSATDAPGAAEFTRAFGPEQGALRYRQLQQSASAGRLRSDLLSLPDTLLQRALDQSRRPAADTASPSIDTPAPANASPDATQPPGTPTADNAALLAQVIAQIRQQRAADPVQSALDTGSHGTRPIDFTPGTGADLSTALRARAASVGDIARDYNVPAAILTRAEGRQLAQALQTLPVDGQRNLLQQITGAISDPALQEAALRQLSADAPVAALAGLYLARDLSQAPPADQRTWGSTPDVPGLLLQGQALLAPNHGAAGTPYALPSDTLLRQAFARYTGEAYAAEPGKAELYLKASKALYAALDPWNKQDPAYDAGRWWRAVGWATDGKVVPQDHGTGVNPMQVLDWENPNPLTSKPDENPRLFAAAGQGTAIDVVEAQSNSNAGATVTAPVVEPTAAKVAEASQLPQGMKSGPYLTQGQIADLDRTLGACIANGCSEAEQKRVIDLFKSIAITQGEIDRPNYNSAGSLQSFLDRIKPDVKLQAQGKVAREAEAYFSAQNALTRPGGFTTYAPMVGESGIASDGPRTPLGSAILSGIGLAVALSESGSKKIKTVTPNDPKEVLPTPSSYLEIDGTKYPVYSETEARKLPRVSGFFFTYEGGDQRNHKSEISPGQAFDAGTSGAMSDPKTGKRLSLAVGYDNSVTGGSAGKGYNFLRIEGHVQNGYLMMPIDAKLGITSLSPSLKAHDAVLRQTQAAMQNGIQIIWEVPDRKTLRRAKKALGTHFGSDTLDSIHLRIRRR